MMKKNKLFVIAFASLLGVFYSCDDAINIKQPGEINDPDIVYSNLNDLERGLKGVYSALSTESTIEFTSIFTDEVSIGINNGGQGIIDGTYNFQLRAGSDAPIAIWQNNYTLINFANRILLASEKVKPVLDTTDPNFDEEDYYQYNSIMGQLYAIRAFAYLQLETYFSTNMADDAALGVMLLDFVPNDDYTTFLPRSTNGEIFAFINADLEKATTMLTLNPDTDITLMNPRVINAMKARMAVYREKYQDAVTYINALGSITLGTGVTAYNALWTDTASTEIIFKLARVNGDFQIGSYWNSQSSTITGSPFFEVSRSLYNAYAATDYRNKESLVDGTSKIAVNPATVPNFRANDVLVINRYPGNTAQSDVLLNDVKVFTYGEMTLLKAEAFAGLGQLNGASNSVAALIRQMERARGVTTFALPVYANATEAWAAILNERRKELAFQGFRYTDIKRLGVKAGNLGIDRYSRDCDQYGSCSLAPSDTKFTMPIPTSELVANPNIRGQQNPGY